jgi:type II secretory pathway pseudopilin PulG
MKQKNIKTSKAFTLLELLVATTIFVGVMLMASTAITNSSTYLSRLKAMRVASDESRRIADILGEDIKKANTEISVKYKINATTTGTKTYKSGIALFYCTASSVICTPQHYDLTNQSTSVSDPNKFLANTLVLGEKDTAGNVTYKVYFNNYADATAIGKILYYSESTSSPIDLTTIGSFYSNNTANMISGEKITGTDLSNDITINFGGYAPDEATIAADSSNRQQAYVYFNIHVSTVRGITNQEIYGLDVLSGITSRNYN